MKRVVSLLLVLLLAGCSHGNLSDLKQFVSAAGSGLPGHIPPLPAVEPYHAFIYDDDALLDPFQPQKLNIATQGGNQAGASRPKQMLESYPLDQLKMVGVLSNKKQYVGIIQTPDNLVYTVRVGEYLGENSGKIKAITDHDIQLTENIQDKNGNWFNRDSTVTLQENSTGK